MKFIKRTVERFTGNRNRKFALYECYCGNTCEKSIDNVKYGITKSCGKCNVRNLKPLPLSINGISVFEDLGMDDSTPKKRIAIFKCGCGTKFTAKVNSVKTGDRKSCGCILNNDKKTHNLTSHPLYRKWSGMITRTTNKKEKCFNRYGGRGISVCEEWKNDFKKFYDWAINNGYKKGLTIDRINNDGNYEPNNCQWLTMRENTMKDMKIWKPTADDIDNICHSYIGELITVTELASQYETHKKRISDILKENNITIDKNRRMKRCLIK